MRWVVLLLLPVGLLLACWGIIVANDHIQVYQLERELASYPLPQATEILARNGGFSYPVNGGWCGAGARMVIRTRLSEADVWRYYGHFRHEGITSGVGSFIQTPIVQRLSPDGPGNQFEVSISRLYMCLIS
jgi:hypothetical protein